MSATFIQKMFPAGQLNGRGGTEVNGLPAGSEPQNVTILSRFNERQLGKSKDRREYFLVQDETHLAYLRVCTAMAGSGYDEFVVIHAVAERGTDEAQRAIDWATRSKDAFTR